MEHSSCLWYECCVAYKWQRECQCDQRVLPVARTTQWNLAFLKKWWYDIRKIGTNRKRILWYDDSYNRIRFLELWQDPLVVFFIHLWVEGFHHQKLSIPKSMFTVCFVPKFLMPRVQINSKFCTAIFCSFIMRLKLIYDFHYQNNYTIWNLFSNMSKMWSILLHDTVEFAPT